jgi:hypothetical protein
MRCYTAAAGANSSEPWKGARVDVEFDRHAGSRQSHGVVGGLVEEQILAAHRNVGRRQIAQVGGTRRTRVRRDALAAQLTAQVGRPAKQVCFAIPDAHVGNRMACRRHVPIVEHRVDQPLEGDRHLASVARQQHQSRGQATAGARVAYGDAARVDAQLTGLSVGPLQRRVAVLDGVGNGCSGAGRYSAETATQPTSSTMC